MKYMWYMVTQRSSIGTPYLIEQCINDENLISEMYNKVVNNYPNIDDFIVIQINEENIDYLFKEEKSNNPFQYCKTVYPKVQKSSNNDLINESKVIEFLIKKIKENPVNICMACNAVGIPININNDKFEIDPDYFKA